MNGAVSRLAHKEWGHPNVTIAKATRFGTGYILVWPLSLGLVWLLTEKAGLWYMVSSVIAGCMAAGCRFLIAALFTFKERKETMCKND